VEPDSREFCIAVERPGLVEPRNSALEKPVGAVEREFRISAFAQNIAVERPTSGAGQEFRISVALHI
jgi:hypothetical protein